MKIIKLFSGCLIASATLLSANAQATNAVAHHPVQKVQHTVKKEAVAKSPLDQFNSIVSIHYLGRSLAKDDKGQEILQFHYELENKSKHWIKQISWIPLFSYENKPVFAQEINIDFGKQIIKVNQKMPVTYSILVSLLTPEAKQVLLDDKAQLTYTSGALGLALTNGTKITIK